MSVQGRARVGVDAPGGSRRRGAVPGGRAAGAAARRGPRLLRQRGGGAGGGGRAARPLRRPRSGPSMRGAATPANLARLVPVPLAPEALVTLLCGSAPLLDGAPVAAEPGDGRVLLTLRDGRPGAAAGGRARARRSSPRGCGASPPAARCRPASTPSSRSTAPAPACASRPTCRRAPPRPAWPSRSTGASWRSTGPSTPPSSGSSPPAGARVVDLDPPAALGSPLTAAPRSHRGPEPPPARQDELLPLGDHRLLGHRRGRGGGAGHRPVGLRRQGAVAGRRGGAGALPRRPRRRPGPVRALHLDGRRRLPGGAGGPHAQGRRAGGPAGRRSRTPSG